MKLFTTLLVFALFSSTWAAIPTTQDVVVFQFSDGHGDKRVTAWFLEFIETKKRIKFEYKNNGWPKPKIIVVANGDNVAKSAYNEIDKGRVINEMLIEIAKDPEVDLIVGLGNHEGDDGAEYLSRNVTELVNKIRELKFAEQKNSDYKNFKIIASNLKLKDNSRYEEYITTHFDLSLKDTENKKIVSKIRTYAHLYGDNGLYFTKAPTMDHIFSEQPFSLKQAILNSIAETEQYNKKNYALPISHVLHANHIGTDELSQHAQFFYTGTNEGKQYRTLPLLAAHSHRLSKLDMSQTINNPLAHIIESKSHFKYLSYFAIDAQGAFRIKPTHSKISANFDFIDYQLNEGEFENKRYYDFFKRAHESIHGSMKILNLDKYLGDLVGATNAGKETLKRKMSFIGRVSADSFAKGGLSLFENYQELYKDFPIIDAVGIQFSSAIREDENIIEFRMVEGEKKAILLLDDLYKMSPLGAKDNVRTFLVKPQTLLKLINEINDFRYLLNQQTHGTQLSSNLIQTKYNHFSFQNKNGQLMALEKLPQDSYFILSLDAFLSHHKKSVGATQPHHLPILASMIFNQGFTEIQNPKKIPQTQLDYYEKFFRESYNNLGKSLVNTEGFIDVYSIPKEQEYLYKKFFPSSAYLKSASKKMGLYDCNNAFSNDE